MHHFARHAASHVRQQERAGFADFLKRDISGHRSNVLVHLHHFTNARSNTGDRFYGAGTECVDSNALRAKIVSHVTHGCFQGRFANSHHVVARHDLFATEIAHAQNRCAVVQDWFGGVADGDQAVGADVHRHFETVSAGLDRVAIQIVGRRESQRVQQEVNFAKLVAGGFHDRRDIVVTLHIHRNKKLGLVSVRELADRFFDSALVALFFVVGTIRQMTESTLTAFGDDLVRDGPRDRTIVSDA